MGERPDPAPRGVFVLGMHRSGTSATMRALTLLGVPACVDSDYIPGLAGNPRGHFESATLMDVNEELLRAAQGTWWAPPSDSALATVTHDPARQDAARARFLAAHPTDQWACKDPRCCLTLDFWARALALAPIVVAVSRNPLEVASSLHKRDGADERLALAIWERYSRSMLAQMQDRAVFLSDYDDLLDDPVGWCTQVHEFLTAAGLTLPQLDCRPVLDSLEPQLRHRRSSGTELRRDPRVTSAQREIYEIMRARAGASDRFDAGRPPDDDGFMDRQFRRQGRLDLRLRRLAQRTVLRHS